MEGRQYGTSPKNGDSDISGADFQREINKTKNKEGMKRLKFKRNSTE
jgi:hypothetical protein